MGEKQSPGERSGVEENTQALDHLCRHAGSTTQKPEADSLRARGKQVGWRRGGGLCSRDEGAAAGSLGVAFSKPLPRNHCDITHTFFPYAKVNPQVKPTRTWGTRSRIQTPTSGPGTRPRSHRSRRGGGQGKRMELRETVQG